MKIRTHAVGVVRVVVVQVAIRVHIEHVRVAAVEVVRRQQPEILVHLF